MDYIYIQSQIKTARGAKRYRTGTPDRETGRIVRFPRGVHGVQDTVHSFFFIFFIFWGEGIIFYVYVFVCVLFISAQHSIKTPK